MTNFHDKKQSKETHYVLLFIARNTVVYFDSFGIEYIPIEVLSKIKDKSISYSIFRIRADDSVMCGLYCIAFVEYMPAGKTLLDYMNLFSSNDFKINDKIIYKCFKERCYKRGRKPSIYTKKIDETRNHILEEIKHNELVSKKHKKTCGNLNYVEHLLILALKVTGCVSISAFASLVGIPIGMASSAATIRSCVITSGIKTYKSIIKKKRKKPDKMLLLGKAMLDAIEFLISETSINWCISHGKIFSANNVLR